MRILTAIYCFFCVLYAVVMIVGLTLIISSTIWPVIKQVWEVIVGIVFGIVYWFMVISPLFYSFPKAVCLVFKGILRPASILKMLKAPAIGVGCFFLIIAGYFENGFIKSCIKVVAGLHISITQPFTFYAAIITIVICSCQFFSKAGRLYAADEFWEKMNRYKKMTA